MSGSRPLVTVQDPSKKKGHSTIPLPAVLSAPIRIDIVQLVHKSISKNHRQPYAVSPDAGMQSSARSWGTGRAVSRIPRVPGGGTHRAGQGAFGNMCRGGRMFAPTKIYRRWHRKVSKGQRRYAICSALAATAVPSLVLSRGHRINTIPEVPFVIADGQINKLKKTKEAVALLQSLKAYEDVEKSINSKRIRPGKGKARGRRFTRAKGPLIIHTKSWSNMLVKSFRNIPGVELCNVKRLNLLTLAPGGHLGRFVIWTESAFKSLDRIFGTLTKNSKVKSGFRIPRPVMSNADLQRIINSDEIQSALKRKISKPKFIARKRNPLTNLGALIKLNPYALTKRRIAIKEYRKAKARHDRKLKNLPVTKPKATIKKKKGPRAGKKFLSILHAPAIAPVRGPGEVTTKYQ
jgi:large subunit ribosomal protein L4e